MGCKNDFSSDLFLHSGMFSKMETNRTDLDLKLPRGYKVHLSYVSILDRTNTSTDIYNPMKIFTLFFFLSASFKLNETLLKVLSSVLFRCTIVSGNRTAHYIFLHFFVGI